MSHFWASNFSSLMFDFLHKFSIFCILLHFEEFDWLQLIDGHVRPVIEWIFLFCFLCCFSSYLLIGCVKQSHPLSCNFYLSTNSSIKQYWALHINFALHYFRERAYASIFLLITSHLNFLPAKCQPVSGTRSTYCTRTKQFSQVHVLQSSTHCMPLYYRQCNMIRHLFLYFIHETPPQCTVTGEKCASLSGQSDSSVKRCNHTTSQREWSEVKLKASRWNWKLRIHNS